MRGFDAIAKRLVRQGPKDVFTRIYEGNEWGNPESVSGDGSTLKYTENIRKEIPELAKRFGIRKIFDAPCGDFNWFSQIDLDSEIEYLGADIVRELIETNRRKYASSRIRFAQCDITEDTLPAADLWLCRDALFHFSDKDIFLTLKNFIESDIHYLLTSSHSDCRSNRDIYTGSFRLLNLELPPFGFPPPIVAFDDWIEGFPVRKLCLWEREALATDLLQNSRVVKAAGS